MGLPTSLMSIPAPCRESNTLSSSPREASIGAKPRPASRRSSALKVVPPAPCLCPGSGTWREFAPSRHTFASRFPEKFFSTVDFQRWRGHGQRFRHENGRRVSAAVKAISKARMAVVALAMAHRLRISLPTDPEASRERFATSRRQPHENREGRTFHPVSIGRRESYPSCWLCWGAFSLICRIR